MINLVIPIIFFDLEATGTDIETDRIPTLIKGNCLIFCLLFRLNNPGSIVLVKWNYQSNVPSFSVLYKGKRYYYKRKNRNQNKYYFNGKVVIE